MIFILNDFCHDFQPLLNFNFLKKYLVSKYICEMTQKWHKSFVSQPTLINSKVFSKVLALPAWILKKLKALFKVLSQNHFSKKSKNLCLRWFYTKQLKQNSFRWNWMLQQPLVFTGYSWIQFFNSPHSPNTVSETV